jgi:hypothetical protein
MVINVLIADLERAFADVLATRLDDEYAGVLGPGLNKVTYMSHVV